MRNNFLAFLWKAVDNYIILYHKAELTPLKALLTSFLCLEFEAISLGQKKMTDKVNLMEGLIFDKMPDASLAKINKVQIIFLRVGQEVA